MRHYVNGLRWLVSLGAFGAGLWGCNEQADQKGKSDMFGLFDRKRGGKSTTVAPEVGYGLQPEAGIPAQIPPPAAPSFPLTQVKYLRGEPPAPVEWAPEEVQGETRRVFVTPVNAGQPPLAVLTSGKPKHVQVWELSTEPVPRFLKQRPVTLDASQHSWQRAYPEAVACLPADRIAMAVGYHDPRKKVALYTYTPATNQFRRIDLIEPDISSGPPFTPFEILAVSPDAALLLYHTEAIRLGLDASVYQHDHVMLFSPSKPEGLAILKLSIDDGNIRAWAVDGKTLWLKTLDRRKTPVEYVWSLDLSKVL